MKFEYYYYNKHTALYRIYEDGKKEYLGVHNGKYCWKDGTDFNMKLDKYKKTTLKDWFNLTDYKGKEILKKELFYDELLDTSDN